MCAIFFSHFVLYPDYRISFFIPLAFRFADYIYGAALEQGGFFLCGMIRLFAFFSILTTEINDAFVYEY